MRCHRRLKSPAPAEGVLLASDVGVRDLPEPAFGG
jgi:hypothetical protein